MGGSTSAGCLAAVPCSRSGRCGRRAATPGNSGCRRSTAAGAQSYLLPHPLPDGRLGLVRECQFEDALKDHFELVAVDPASGKVERLARLGLGNPASVTWQDDLRHGFISYYSDFCGSMAPVTRAGVQRWPGPTTVGGRTWALDQDFFEPADADCTPRGRAVLPLVTPNGGRLAYLASPESAG
jgi:hypothetical protein